MIIYKHIWQYLQNLAIILIIWLFCATVLCYLGFILVTFSIFGENFFFDYTFQCFNNNKKSSIHCLCLEQINSVFWNKPHLFLLFLRSLIFLHYLTLHLVLPRKCNFGLILENELIFWTIMELMWAFGLLLKNSALQKFQIILQSFVKRYLKITLKLLAISRTTIFNLATDR